MKTVFLLSALICISAQAIQAASLPDPLPLYDLDTGRKTTLTAVLDTIARSRIVLVGERHTEERHHEAQLRVVKALHQAGRPLAVGMEMFRADSNPALAAWVAGRTPESEFEAVYRENWNFPWPLYRDLLVYARDEGIPALGLNVPRAVTRQVAREGFRSLTEAQRGDLPMVTCEVDEAYMRFIREAHGAHGHGGMNFTYFCEAQLVWDKAMAANAVAFLEAHPDATMVLVAGTGHVRKGGIPTRVREIADMPVTVILPEIPGVIDPETATSADADYLILGLD